MTPDVMISLLAAMSGEDMLAISEPHLARMSAPRAERGGAVAVIPVTGSLMPRSMSGPWGVAAGMDALRARIDAAARNPDVAAIVLDMDSPGGTVSGTHETAAAVASAAAVKPVVAVANTLAASAAYWIASQASEIVMAPNAIVGSVGVMSVHANVARMYERMGVEMTVIRSGARKAEGHPFAPLDDAARDAIQARVDEAAGAFLEAVAGGRRMSAKAARERFGDGRVMSAREAIDTGMADRVATLDDVIAGMVAGKGKAWRRRSALAFA